MQTGDNLRLPITFAGCDSSKEDEKACAGALIESNRAN